MSSIPYLSFDARWGMRMGHARLVDGMFQDGFIDPLTGKHMGELCDALAKRRGIVRGERDALALESQQRTARARGHTGPMLAPVPVPQAKGDPHLVGEDEHPRQDTTLDKLAKLPPAFGNDGTITAENASGITDGAVALVLASAEAAERMGARSLGRVLGTAVAALAPEDYAIASVAFTSYLAGLEWPLATLISWKSTRPSRPR